MHGMNPIPIDVPSAMSPTMLRGKAPDMVYVQGNLTGLGPEGNIPISHIPSAGNVEISVFSSN